MSRPEPTFTLKATDPHAAAALDRYADLLESQRAPVGKISAARHAAQKMRGWLAEQKPETKAAKPEEPEPAVTEIEPVAEKRSKGSAKKGFEPAGEDVKSGSEAR